MNDCGKCGNVTGIKSLKTLQIVCGKGHEPAWIAPTNIGAGWGWMCEKCGDDFTPKQPKSIDSAVRVMPAREAK